MTESLCATLHTERRLALGWSYLAEVTNGKSAIDLGALGVRDIEDARQFARAYGFDLDDAREVELLRRTQQEAVSFVRRHFLPMDQADLIPAEVADPADVLQLLVFASRHVLSSDLRRLWSCAILKVMHCIIYIDNNLRLRHFDSIREQVFTGLDAVLRCKGGRHFLTDGELCLPIVHCERKSNKGRDSVLMKLLHKAEYVAADISDHLGVRLVFDTRIECLLALRVLQRSQLLSVINIEPQRTRNTLIDVLAAREIFARYRDRIEAADEYPTDLLREMDAELCACADQPDRRDNPHSAAGYHSLQLTARKMIRIDDLAGSAHRRHDDANVGRGNKFFFEYEIQLLDRASYEATQAGPASHESYKQRQLRTARKRVLGAELMRVIAAASMPIEQN